MKNLSLFLLLLFFPATAIASSFSEVKTGRMDWIYTFAVKSGIFADSTPVTIFEHNCTYYAIVPETHPELFKKEFLHPHTDCFDTEAAARADAQGKADQFEKELAARGESTTEIEKRRKAAPAQ